MFIQFSFLVYMVIAIVIGRNGGNLVHVAYVGPSQGATDSKRAPAD